MKPFPKIKDTFGQFLYLMVLEEHQESAKQLLMGKYLNTKNKWEGTEPKTYCRFEEPEFIVRESLAGIGNPLGQTATVGIKWVMEARAFIMKRHFSLKPKQKYYPVKSYVPRKLRGKPIPKYKYNCTKISYT